MAFSVPLGCHLVEWKISTFTSWKYFPNCTHIHSLIYIHSCLLHSILKIISLCQSPCNWVVTIPVHLLDNIYQTTLCMVRSKSESLRTKIQALKLSPWIRIISNSFWNLFDFKRTFFELVLFMSCKAIRIRKITTLNFLWPDIYLRAFGHQTHGVQLTLLYS
jgi:hypothetical protein